MPFDPSLIRGWIEADFDPQTIGEASELLNLASQTGGQADSKTIEQARESLRSRFSTELSLRPDGVYSLVEAGCGRVNAAMVARNVAALCRFINAGLLATKEKDPAFIIIGYDQRDTSPKLAGVAAAVAAGCGAKVKVFPQACSSGALAFGVNYFKAEAGIMISGSHRGPRENGLKVYMGGRAAPPNHHGALLSAANAATIADLAASGPRACDIRQSNNFQPLDEDLDQLYAQHLASQLHDFPVLGAHKDPVFAAERNAIRIIAGVCAGDIAPLVKNAFAQAGFGQVKIVGEEATEEQSKVGPHPRSEEYLGPLLEEASSFQADLVVNMSPDAARLVVALPSGNPKRPWHVLDSDEVALLALNWVCQRDHAHLVGKTPTFVSTVFCSSYPRQAALSRGLRTVTYPTGFSLMCRQGGVVFAYQQRDGFAIDLPLVKDCDGLSMALVLASLAAHAGTKTKTGGLSQLLFSSFPGTPRLSERFELRFDTLFALESYISRVRSGRTGVVDFAGSRVVSWCDLSRPCPHGPGCVVRLQVGGLPTPVNAIAAVGAGGERVIIRPRPAELEASIHVEVPVVASDFKAWEAARCVARRRVKEIFSSLSADKE